VPISEVQGDTDTSPRDDDTLTVEAVVTSVLTGDDEGDQLGGFFIEEEIVDRDTDPDTSEGIFVFAGAQSDSLDLDEGEVVEVTGLVEERFGQTQINASTGTISEIAPAAVGSVLLPAPAEVDELPDTTAGRTAEFEPFEGMRVQLQETWVVTEQFNLHTNGEVELVPGTQPLQSPTNIMEPGDAAGELEDKITANLKVLYLDDTRDGNLTSGEDRPAPLPVG